MGEVGELGSCVFIRSQRGSVEKPSLVTGRCLGVADLIAVRVWGDPWGPDFLLKWEWVALVRPPSTQRGCGVPGSLWCF